MAKRESDLPTNTPIAAITTCRNDTIFLQKWVDYYGRAFGEENLFIILDGHDQAAPPNLGRANLMRLPHQPLERVPAMRRRARVMSDSARGLHRYFDIVIATDVDEFLLLDPQAGDNLATYLQSIKSRSSVSGLGLDVGQKLGEEDKLDPSKPFLSQRQYAHVSSRYTKPCTTYKPLTWGSGMHRIKGHNFHIDPNLYHFHFGMVDYELATGKTGDKDRLATGWEGHLERRHQLFSIIKNNEARNGDDYFDEARRLETRHRPPYALNKPAMIKGDPVIKIPQRFAGMV